jgi:hypothetical protein
MAEQELASQRAAMMPLSSTPEHARYAPRDLDDALCGLHDQRHDILSDRPPGPSAPTGGPSGTDMARQMLILACA